MSNRIISPELRGIDLRDELGAVKILKSKIPDLQFSSSDLKKGTEQWASTLPKLNPTNNRLRKIKARSITQQDLSKLRFVHESTTPTTEALVGQKFTDKDILSTLYSSISTFEYSKMESEYRKTVSYTHLTLPTKA